MHGCSGAKGCLGRRYMLRTPWLPAACSRLHSLGQAALENHHHTMQDICVPAPSMCTHQLAMLAVDAAVLSREACVAPWDVPASMTSRWRTASRRGHVQFHRLCTGLPTVVLVLKASAGAWRDPCMHCHSRVACTTQACNAPEVHELGDLPLLKDGSQHSRGEGCAVGTERLAIKANLQTRRSKEQVQSI